MIVISVWEPFYIIASNDSNLFFFCLRLLLNIHSKITHRPGSINICADIVDSSELALVDYMTDYLKYMNYIAATIF